MQYWVRSGLWTETSVSFTLEDGLSRFWLTGGDTGETPWKHTHTSSSCRVPSRLFRSRSTGFLFEINSSSSLQRCFALCEWTTAENWRTTAAVLMWCYLQLIGLDLDWKLCRDSAFSQRKTGLWIWVSRFRLRYLYHYSPMWFCRFSSCSYLLFCSRRRWGGRCSEGRAQWGDGISRRGPCIRVIHGRWIGPRDSWRHHCHHWGEGMHCVYLLNAPHQFASETE